MKHTKKILSLLLVMAMIFTLAIPAFAEEAKTATLTAASELKTGDQVVIYTAAYGKAMDACETAASFYNAGVDVSVADGKMTVPSDSVIWDVTVNDDGTYYFSQDGKKLSMDKSYSSMPYDKANDKWSIVETDNGYNIKNVGRNVFVEWYVDKNYYSGYKTIAAGTEGMFCQTFYKVDVAPIDPPTPGEFDGKTVILHTNDVHGDIADYAKIAALKAEYEAKGAEVILADAGDYSQGTAYVSTSKGGSAISMMNITGYDIATLGNHEFDYGWAQLQENMKCAEFKVLCADVLENGETIFDGHKIIEKGGVKIGFFGMETPEAQTKANPALIQGLTFLAGDAMYAAAQAQVDALKAEGADVVICLAHLGLDNESVPNRSVDMLGAVNGIDMIIDGHSHTVIAATAEQPIQSTGTAFANIGVIVVDNATKAIVDNYLVQIKHTEKIDSKDVTVYDYEPTDEAVAAAAQDIIDRVNEEYGKVFAKSEVELNGDKAPGNRNMETNMGDLITDSMVWQVMQNKEGLTVDDDHVVAITNGGGIRAWIHQGDISKKDVNTVLPFGNTIAVVYVTGAELLEALEASTYCTPGAVGGFPQVAGIDFTILTKVVYNANKETYPASTYYGPATINRVTINSINGKDFDPEATYAVITNNFCAAGGDTYYAFAAASAQFDTGVPLDEALMAYISEELDGVVGQQYAAPQGRIHLADTHFNDIKDSGYRVYIDSAAEIGIVTGYADGTFRPSNSVTRAQFITMLYRAAGEPEAENTELSFSDAAQIAEPFRAAVAWGVEQGIIKGYGDNTFRPNANITRAQMATFMARYIQSVKGPADAAAKASFGFVDEAGFAAAFADSINFIANLGIMNGVNTAPTFNANGIANRGMAATVLLRLSAFMNDSAEAPAA